MAAASGVLDLDRGFTIGALSHIWDILHADLNTYSGYAEPIPAFWISLTLLYPLIVPHSLVQATQRRCPRSADHSD